MNNTFNFKRFALYARKHYWENRKSYILLLLAVMVGVYTIEIKGLIYDAVNASNEIVVFKMQSIIKRFQNAFFIMLSIFTISITYLSIKGSKGVNFKMDGMLLPISFQEKFWFAILNIMVVGNIVFFAGFYIVTSYVDTLYYFTDNAYVFKGFLDKEIISQQGLAIEDMKNSQLFSLAKFFKGSNLTYYTPIIFGYLYTVSTLMWFTISFPKLNKANAIIINYFSHALFISSISFAFVYIGNITIGEIINIQNENIQVIYDLPILLTKQSVILDYVVPIFWILPMIYFWCAWKKLKTFNNYK